MLTIFLPVVLLFFSSALVAAGIFALIEKAQDTNFLFLFSLLNTLRDAQYRSLCQRFSLIRVVYNMIMCLLATAFVLALGTICVGLGFVITCIMIVPMYIIYFYVVIKLKTRWG
jgi:hypothetical protein